MPDFARLRIAVQSRRGRSIQRRKDGEQPIHICYPEDAADDRFVPDNKVNRHATIFARSHERRYGAGIDITAVRQVDDDAGRIRCLLDSRCKER